MAYIYMIRLKGRSSTKHPKYKGARSPPAITNDQYKKFVNVK